MSRMSKRRALKLLRKILAEGKYGALLYCVYPERRSKWERNATITIQAVFGKDSRHVEELLASFKQRFPWRNRSANLLESMIYEVENTWPRIGERVPSGPVQQDTSTSSRAPLGAPGERVPSGPIQHDSRKVFLVHGHDGEVKQTVARFLEKNGLNVIILDEIAGQGRTIIEKFEQHSSVGYAVVLMTPDDATEHPEDGASERRARQNVVFELGFFVGALERGRVCVIAKGDVKIPSNYWGVEYIPWDDSEGWKYKLLREPKAANLAVNEG